MIKQICQVCGYEEEFEVPRMGETEVFYDWYLHRVQFVGSWVDVLTCVECNCLTLDQIFEGYKTRIRSGGIPGYH